MGTRGRLLLVPTHCLGFLGCQWWPDPRDLLRSWALTKTHSLLVLICRVGGRTCEIYPVALCTSRNCGSGGSLGGPSHAVVLHQHFYHSRYVVWYQEYHNHIFLVHRIARWSQVAVLYGCVKFLVSGCRCHRWCNARKPCDDCVTVHRITGEGVLEVLWFSCPQLLGERRDLSLNSPRSE